MSNTEVTFYYELSSGRAKTFNNKTGKFETITMNELYKKKKHFSLLVGYEPSSNGLKRFASDFFKWVDEIKGNKVFTFDYLKYKSHEQACKEMFKKLCNEKFEEMEDIDSTEYEFIEACNNAGLRYCKAGKYNCYGYDYSSQYPAILASEALDLPTCKGKLTTLTTIEQNTLEVGYYTVIISSNDERFKKVFAFSKKNVYTHTSLLFALKCKNVEGYNVNIEIVQKVDNCYLYGKYKKDNITRGSIVFGKWYKHLFGLKETLPKNKLVKYITSALWGHLAQHNRRFKTMDEIIDENIDVSPEFDTNHEYYIRNVTQTRKREDLYELVNCKKPYYFNIARVKSFLLSKSRSLIGCIAMKYIDDVVRIHTDNVTFDKEHDDVIYHTKTFKLTKEDKTTGLIEFRRTDCYKHYDNDKYTTKNFKDEYLNDSDDE